MPGIRLTGCARKVVAIIVPVLGITMMGPGGAAWRIPASAIHDGDNVVRLHAKDQQQDTLVWCELDVNH